MILRILSKIQKFKILIILGIAGIILPVIFVSAEYDLNTVCENEGWKEACNTITDDECKDMLNQCQAYFEEKRIAVESDITKTSAEKNTLKTQITSLGNKIKDLDYQIYQSNLAVKSLGFQIKDTEQSIIETASEVEQQKKKIGLVLRAVADEDKKSFLEVLIVSKTLSEFFD
ncbi:MAG: hypothetical protein PHD31_02880, partial [Candidatus Pacebacteria bacterium]|nr:hypothetical protein [Candidatus Paceibacterota bacterium]